MIQIISKDIIQRGYQAARGAVSKTRRDNNKSLSGRAPEGIEVFAVGADCGGGCRPAIPNQLPCPPGNMNDCYMKAAEKFGCPLKAVGGGVRGLGPGSALTFAVVPDLANFFLPIAIRATIRDAAAPGTQLVGRFTSITINAKPQEVYNDTAPTAVSVSGVEINGYANKTGTGESYGLPAYEVAWGPFSRDSLAERIAITAINDDPALTAIVHIDIWGFPISGLLPGWECGTHPSRLPGTAG